MKPLTIYHGSNAKFSNFEYAKIGSAAGTSGAGIGFYFTTDIDEAKSYGKYIYELKLGGNDIKKEVSNVNRSFNRLILNRIIEDVLVKSKGDYNYYENYGDYSYNDYINKTNIKLLQYIKLEVTNNLITLTDTEILTDFVTSGIDIELLCETLLEMGYTHTRDQYDSSKYKNSQHYILYFKPKNFKIIE